MAGIQRVGDKNVAGGAIMTGSSDVFVNGKPVALINAPVSSHSNFKGSHVSAKTTNVGGTSTVFVNNKLVCVSGSTDSCGHKRISGSSDTNVG
jgi:uncharacterized Zn-binding protein involved in type VI secretion